MDEKLRKLKRAIVDDETAARYVAACVQSGFNTRERVLLAASMRNPIALLLEPQAAESEHDNRPQYKADHAVDMLTSEERIALAKRLFTWHTVDLLKNTLQSHRLHPDDDVYNAKVDAQFKMLSKILLKLDD